MRNTSRETDVIVKPIIPAILIFMVTALRKEITNDGNAVLVSRFSSRLRYYKNLSPKCLSHVSIL